MPNETVSWAAVAGMAFTVCASVILPIAVMIVFKRKTQGRISCVFIGACVFILAVLAEVLVGKTLKAVIPAFGETLRENYWLLALYGGMSAGLFEETGRFLAMRFLMKKTLSKENSVMYGIGHSGIEAVLVVGIPYVVNLVIAGMINLGKMDTFLSGLNEPLKNHISALNSALLTTPAGLFYVSGIERIAAFAFHICMSYLVYRAIRDRKAVFFLAAVALHFLIDAVTVILAKTVSDYAAEAVLSAVTVCVAVFTYRKYKSESPCCPFRGQPEAEESSGS
ncbi:MAG: YhfC family intramembrane metalloprotease [Thermoguttaceae bacterium]|nr:YhfC family intramembrane metalloprotease [Thermoguttaceae bacterium]MBR6480277.1 YhfC family intramembrane metalloprotease [Thermoguttaceae bacterium]